MPHNVRGLASRGEMKIDELPVFLDSARNVSVQIPCQKSKIKLRGGTTSTRAGGNVGTTFASNSPQTRHINS